MKINTVFFNNLKYAIISFIILTNHTYSNCQTYRVFNLNTDEYPILSVNFNDYYNNSDTLNISKIEVLEDNQQAEIVGFDPGSSYLIPSSIIITLDISGSMDGQRLNILKEATKEFINFLPLEVCEVAIATFNSQIQLNCDYTHNKKRLLKTIDFIKAEGSTNFDVAFLESKTGVIDIANQGKFRKNVVFITDGLSTLDVENVITAANKDDITINCLTINLETPQVLKDIAIATGGNYYEELSRKNEIESIYNAIYTEIQTINHGFIKWKAINTCRQEVHLKVKINGDLARLSYIVPEGVSRTIKTKPSTLYFTHNNLFEKVYKSIRIDPNISNLTIENIYSEDSSKYNFEKLAFPFEIRAKEPKEIKFIYTPKDNFYTFNQYTIYTEECPEIKINAYGGNKNKLELITPKGGETLIAGSETIISWTGVSRTTNIELFYSKNSSLKWIPIGSDIEYAYDWDIPADTGSLVRIKAQCTNELNYHSINNAKLIIQGKTTFLSASYNEEGDEIITTDKYGDIKSFGKSEGKEIFNFEKAVMGRAIFQPAFNRVIALSDNQLSLFTNRNGKYIDTYYTNNKRLKTSLLTSQGKEYYSTIIQPNQSILWDPLQNRQIYRLSKRKIKEASISKNSEFLMTLTKNRIHIWDIENKRKRSSIKLNSKFESAIFHNYRNIISLNYNDKIILIDVEKRNNKHKIEKEQFVRYSPEGKYLVSNDSSKLYLYNLLTWERAFALTKPDFYYFSENDELSVFKRNDTIKIYNINTKNVIYEDVFPECSTVRFYPKSTKLLIVSSQFLSIIDYNTDSLIYKLNYKRGFVEHAEISPDEKDLLFISNDNILIWEPIDIKESTVSDYFSIISPSPLIKDSLNFPKQLINTQQEIVFNDFLVNAYNYPIRIKEIFIDAEIKNEFSIISSVDSFTILPKTSQNIEIGFKPKSKGIKKGYLNAVTPTDTLRSLITGIGISLNAKLLTKRIDFGKIPWNTEKDTIVPLLKKYSDTLIQIASIDISQAQTLDFHLLEQVKNKVLYKDDTLWVKIKFKPIERGRMNAILNIIVQGIDTPIKCQLLGESIAKRSLIVYGRTINDSNNKPIRATVLCTDLISKTNVIKIQSNKEGVFSFTLNTDRNYSLFAESQNYMSNSVNLDLVAPQLQDTIYTEILLSPIDSNPLVRLNNVFFETGSAELSDLSVPELKRLTGFLKSNKSVTIEIHGHTDSEGSSNSNLILSKSRALSVKTYIMKTGINESRLTLKFFGESQPVASNNTKAGRMLNRRVDIKVTKK